MTAGLVAKSKAKDGSMLQIEELVWDEQAEGHIARHGVSMWEVEEAVQNGLHARRSRQYLMLLCQTNAGRYLTLILDRLGHGQWYPVTARDMTRAERRLANRGD